MQTDIYFQSQPGKDVMSQVLDHLQKKTLTTWEAITLYNCTRLSAYIHILKDRGHNITSTWKHHNGKRFTEYKLI